MRPLDKRDGLTLLVIALGCGLTSSLLGIERYDTTRAVVQAVVTAAGLTVGLLCAWGCLRLSTVDPEHRWPGALWLVIPWYFLFASQLAYLGHLLIALEILVGAACLAHRAQASASLALSVSTAVRVAIFALHSILPAWL
jgi:hypothetical protein